jgi:uncharacterized protein
MKKLFFLILFFSGITVIVNAQMAKNAATRSHELIEKAIEIYGTDNYQAALDTLLQVHVCDVNYPWALYEMSLCYNSLDQQDKAYEACKEALKLDPENTTILAALGSFLDDMGQRTEAIKMLEEAVQKYPYNSKLLYNLGICYYNTDDLVKAEEVLLRDIRINPFHTNSHIILGKINYRMGRIGQAQLAFSTAILMSPGSSTIAAFEEVITGKTDMVSKSYLYPYPDNFDHSEWDNLSDILKTEGAFKKKFKYDDINYVTTRQSYFLFNNMKYNPSDNSLYNQFYIRFFKELMENDFTEMYFHYSISNIKDDDNEKWLDKNKRLNKSFINWATSTIFDLRKYDYSPANEATATEVMHMNDEGVLEEIGTLKGKPSPVHEGDWIQIGPNGQIKARSHYENDKMNGEAFFYNSKGAISQHLFFKNDTLDGECETFNPDGTKAGIHPRKNGKTDGIEVRFTMNGLPLSEESYQNDKLDGKVKVMRYNDGFSREMFYKNGKAEGKITEKWLNGKPKTEGQFADSLVTGKLISYYANGSIESENYYLKDKRFGKQVEYYLNGKIKSVYECDSTGELTGFKKHFDRKGNLTEKSGPYSSGILTGKDENYFTDGKPNDVFTYSNDTLVSFISYDNSGKRKFADSAINNKVSIKFFYANGNILSEGILINGNQDGIWKYYFPNGSINKLFNYAYGKQNGLQKTFYVNGSPDEIYSCDSNYLTGDYKEYHSNGKLKVSGAYLKSGRDGLWYTFFENDSIENIVFYNEGIPAGRSIDYFPSGKKQSELFYDENGEAIRVVSYNYLGEVTGDFNYSTDTITLKDYYTSGQLRKNIKITDRLIDGNYEWYYPDGQLQSTYNYIFGNADGIAKLYFPDGTLAREYPYFMNDIDGVVKAYENGKLSFTDYNEKGKSEGIYTEFYSNGKTFRILENSDDKRNGYGYYYSPDSLLMFRFYYINDFITEISYLDKSNNWVVIPVKTDTKTITTYYSTGKISSKINFSNGLIEGEYITYYPTGQVFKKTNNLKNDYEGEVIVNYLNGKPRIVMNYHNDKLDGLYVSYYLDGKKQSEGSYFMNKEIGEWKYYKTDGELEKVLMYNYGEPYEIRKP